MKYVFPFLWTFGCAAFAVLAVNLRDLLGLQSGFWEMYHFSFFVGIPVAYLIYWLDSKYDLVGD